MNSTTNVSKTVTWLHISDLHIGQDGDWLWPNFKAIFIDDLLRIAVEEGPIDLVIFSGDLTQRAETAEFELLTKELKWIWQKFKSIDQNPLLLLVPGNHDLQRPPAKDAAVKLMKKWNDDVEVGNEFWGSETNQYLDLVKASFENYSVWSQQLNAQGIPLASQVYGRVPGDVAASLNINGVSVGLVGLNTAFLQLGNEDYKGKLVVDVRQLNALTDNDPSGWCDKHDLNFLVTHHPVSWLSSESARHFQAEIYPSNRFTAHFYGHMHEAELQTVFRGGDLGRKSFQSSSLFGLERVGDGNIERVHGYSIGRICIGEAEGQWQLWPRKGIVNRSSGDRRIVPDHENFHLTPGKEYLLETIQLRNQAAVSKPSKQPVSLAAKVEETNPLWAGALRNTAYSLQAQEQHVGVRLLQQQACAESIRQRKMVWVSADWGLGVDGFLWSVAKHIGRDAQRVYRLSLENYSTREGFLGKFGAVVGCSFPEYCKVLANVGPAILILDETPVTLGESNGKFIEEDAEGLALMVRDFCPEIVVVMLSRTAPRSHKVTVVKLDALDEVDTKTYLWAHPAANNEVRSSRAVTDIHRLTEGLPGKIDRALKMLRVVSLAELGPASSGELISVGASSELVPMSLVNAVGDLANSKDPDMKRTYLLLTALAILPHGETLQRLKRIKQETPIFPKHAEELLEQDLIQVRTSTFLIRSDSGEESHAKLLVAPSPVRDYVLSKMSKRDVDQILSKATSLYFGDDWQTGAASLKRLSGYLTTDDGNLLQNPQFLITRFLASDDTWSSVRAASPVLQLCRIYCAALLEGKYYRHAMTVCRDFLSMIPSTGYEQDRDTIEIILSKCLRMLGQHKESKELLVRLIAMDRSKDVKATLLLSLALCLQSLKDPEASELAEQVIKLAPKSGNAAQARAIMLEMQADVNNESKLAQLELEARRKGFNTVANNLTLDRAARSSDDEDLSQALNQVYLTAMADDDQYTATRAIVKLADITLQKGTSISNENLNRLINAYQYSYGERFNGLFTSAHRSLWTIFTRENDVKNMLILFRHSSFIWRLQGEDGYEVDYVQRLINAARHILKTDVLTADQNTAYFLLRARDIEAS